MHDGREDQTPALHEKTPPLRESIRYPGEHETTIEPIAHLNLLSSEEIFPTIGSLVTV